MLQVHTCRYYCRHHNCEEAQTHQTTAQLQLKKEETAEHGKREIMHYLQGAQQRHRGRSGAACGAGCRSTKLPFC